MDCMPPATMISFVPQAKRSFANIAAFIPEPHILFTVVQPAASGRPAPSEAWRAGAWPCPAGSTQPMITSCTSSGEILARSTAARIAAAPSSGAAKPFSSPWKAPIGVLAAEAMTIGSGCMEFSFQKLLDRLNGFGFKPGDQFGGRQGAPERRALKNRRARFRDRGAAPANSPQPPPRRRRPDFLASRTAHGRAAL